jgi:hypothetical protein
MLAMDASSIAVQTQTFVAPLASTASAPKVFVTAELTHKGGPVAALMEERRRERLRVRPPVELVAGQPLQMLPLAGLGGLEAAGAEDFGCPGSLPSWRPRGKQSYLVVLRTGGESP